MSELGTLLLTRISDDNLRLLLRSILDRLDRLETSVEAIKETQEETSTQ